MHELLAEVGVPPLPEALVAQSTYRRNGLAVYDAPVLARVALLAINLQNAWLAPDASFRAGPAAGLLWRIHKAAAAVRAAGGQVVWLRTVAGEPGSTSYWHTYYDHFIEPAKRVLALQALRAGQPGVALHPLCAVDAADWVLDKHRFTPFVRAPQDLESRLRARGIDAVIVAGTATNVCVEATVRDAQARDFQTFMPYDLVTAPSESAHLAGLRNVMQALADVRASTEILGGRPNHPSASVPP